MPLVPIHRSAVRLCLRPQRRGSVVELSEHRDAALGLRMVYEPKYLRFFKARFERLPAG